MFSLFEYYLLGIQCVYSLWLVTLKRRGEIERITSECVPYLKTYGYNCGSELNVSVKFNLEWIVEGSWARRLWARSWCTRRPDLLDSINIQ
jgi:hypothetical protein